jgi:hypothetical protein
MAGSSTILRIVLALAMVLYVPVCLCGGDRAEPRHATASVHKCCHHGQAPVHDPQKHPKKTCDCSPSPVLSASGLSLAAVDLPAVADAPCWTSWTPPWLEGGAAQTHSIKALRAPRPSASLLRQHCALIV